jgi:hypothetical protein
MKKFTDPAMRDCIQQCWDCRDTCQATLYNYCLEQGGHHVEQAHVRLMADCIQACQTAADFMTRGSELHAVMCSACAEVCDACAESCEAMEDEAMDLCARTCRDCADSCRRMSQMARTIDGEAEPVARDMPL